MCQFVLYLYQNFGIFQECSIFLLDDTLQVVRYKDLRLIHLDIIGTDKYSALLQSLEQLAQV